MYLLKSLLTPSNISIDSREIPSEASTYPSEQNFITIIIIIIIMFIGITSYHFQISSQQLHSIGQLGIAWEVARNEKRILFRLVFVFRNDRERRTVINREQQGSLSYYNVVEETEHGNHHFNAFSLNPL